MKKTKNTTLSEQFQNPIEKSETKKRGKLDTANTNIHHRSFQCLVQALQYTEQVTGLS